MELVKVGDLGVGFESTVSLVREVKSGQLFALKVSKNKKFANREVEIHKDLQHKHIISLIDAFQTPEEVTMVIEFAPRGSLYDLILKCGTIDEVLMSKITYQTTLALDYLHDHGIMHLDIKPDNILISESNQVKLADFGLSVKKASGSEPCGSYPYMPPEIVNMDKYDQSADMWSLGTTIYNALFGKAPFGEDTPHLIMKRIRAFEFSMPTATGTTSTARVLLESLIVVDNKKRLTTKQMLKHQWLCGHEE